MAQLRNTSLNSRTKKQFKQSFIKLIKEKGYSKVTVKDIVEHAQFNRTTFYLYYEDKQAITEDLMQEMQEKIIKNCINNYKKNKKIKVDSLTVNSFTLFYFIEENQQFFDLFLQDDTLPQIHNSLPNAIFEALNNHFYMTFNVESGLNHHQIKYYMAYGTAGLIIDWIKNRYIKTTEEMTEELIGLMKIFVSDFHIK